MKTSFNFLIYIISFSVCPFCVFSHHVARRALTFDTQIHGVVMDPDLKLPLAYASVGVLNKPVGTISDSLGKFDLAIGSEYINDTLQISMVGYYPVKKSIRELANVNGAVVINLTRKVMQLNEVVVSAEFQHTLIIGRQSNGSLLQVSIIPRGGKGPIIGAESGLKIESKHYPSLLDDFNFYLSANNYKYIKFRLNIYSLKNNLPDTILFNKDILIEIKNFKTGWNKIDLTPYHMIVNSDIAMTMQWVDYNKDMVKEPQVLIPVSLSLSHISYFRIASQDKWNRAKVNPSFFVTLKY